MMNIGNLGSKESIRDKFKEGQIVFFNFKMKFHQISGFIANVQKESSKQSLPKNTSEAAIRIHSSKKVF